MIEETRKTNTQESNPRPSADSEDDQSNSSPIQERKPTTKELLQWARMAAHTKLATLAAQNSAPSVVVPPNATATPSTHQLERTVLRGSESPAAAATLVHSIVTRHLRPSVPSTSKSLSRDMSTSTLVCSDCELKMSLGIVRPFTCVRCDRSFCSRHAPPVVNGVTFELRLHPKTLRPDPSGRWHRVCRHCFAALRPAPADDSPRRSLFGYFVQVRGEFQDFGEIEATRLERRLEKLADHHPQRHKMPFGEYEKTIVPWQSDVSATTCYICPTPFTITNRRHHCRLCGRVICAECVQTIPLRLADGTALQLKSCRHCHQLLFRRKPDDQSPANLRMLALFSTIAALRRQILDTIPQFNAYLVRLSCEKDQLQLQHDAWALRDTLILVSLHMRATFQELAELAESEGTESTAWRLFGANVRRAGNAFIQTHMFTLQILTTGPPTTTRDAPDGDDETLAAAAAPSKSAALKTRLKRLLPDALARALDSTSSLDSLGIYDEEGVSLPVQANATALATKTAVLCEQRDQLQQLRTAATSVDEAAALDEALLDVNQELRRLARHR